MTFSPHFMTSTHQYWIKVPYFLIKVKQFMILNSPHNYLKPNL